MPTVSVIVPIYGIFDTKRASMTVASIQKQIGVELEIVVTEEGDCPRFKPEGHSIVHVFSRHESGKPDDYNPGLIRNRGVESSSGEFVYTTDADIIFQHPSFLEYSIALFLGDKDAVFKWPAMRQLPELYFDRFFETFSRHGIDSALSNGLTTTIGVGDDVKTEPDKLWHKVHCGGNLFRRKHFETVGRYCELFQNWGFEDYDLQWKFEQKFHMIQFPDATEFEVLHLNHSKPYLVKELFDRNKVLRSERRQRGIQEAIRRDFEQLRLRAA